MDVIAAVKECGFCPETAAASPPPWLPIAMSITGVASLLVAMLAASALLLRDRRVPDWLVSFGAFAFGVSTSLAVIGWSGAGTVTLVANAAAVAVGPLIGAWSRRFGLAGWCLVGASLPAVLWWGFFIVQDLMTPSTAYADDLVVGFVSPALLGALGLGGILIGDRAPNQPEPRPPNEPDPSRVTAVATAYARACRAGTVDLPNVLSLGLAGAASIAATTLLLVTGVDLPWASAFGIAIFVALGTELFYRLQPPRLRAAMATHALVGSPELRRFRRELGGPVPTSAAMAADWLKRNPETDANRWVRPEMLAWTGAIDEAYEVVGRMPETTELERFERQSLRALVDLVAGRPADIAGLEALAEEVGIPGSDDRLRAVAVVALTRSRERLVHGEEWTGPLIEAQPRIGPEALGIYRSDTWMLRFRALAAAGAGIGLVTVLPAILQ